MDIIKCSMCRKPFVSAGSKMCPECVDQVEIDYIKVRDYLRENQFTEMEVVSEETEVPMKMILHLLKEGRLEIGSADGADVGGGILFCEVCKKPISTGKMCSDCKNAVANRMQKNLSAVGGIAEKPKKEKPIYSEKKAAKMHTDHRK